MKDFTICYKKIRADTSASPYHLPPSSTAIQYPTHQITHRRTYRSEYCRMKHIAPVEAVPYRTNCTADRRKLYISHHPHRFPPSLLFEENLLPPYPIPSR